MSKNIPPRLHVLLARDANTAVVIRRGPSRRVAVIGWDRKHDRFSLGQCMKGRLYERRSDLSPDGRFFIYFAMNGRWHRGAKGSWTAVSYAPYLKAISLYAKGDCWHGGGLFRSDKTFWLNDGYGHQMYQESPRLKCSREYFWHESYGGECPGVYYIRLQRDGWKMCDFQRELCVFEKPLNALWTLRKLAHQGGNQEGQGIYFDSHELVNRQSGLVIPKEDWEWADLDGQRLVWAAGGCLYASKPSAHGTRNPKLLYDFTQMDLKWTKAPY